jgi:hypothetical protein
MTTPVTDKAATARPHERDQDAPRYARDAPGVKRIASASRACAEQPKAHRPPAIAARKYPPLPNKPDAFGGMLRAKPLRSPMRQLV